MWRWLRVLIGPLPATVLLLPLLFAGGLGSAVALVTALVQPGRMPGDRWSDVMGPAVMLGWIAAAGVGVAALWIAVLGDELAALRRGPARWWLLAGLAVGLLAAGRWLWLMEYGGHRYDQRTWAVWLALLLGPIVVGAYCAVRLVRGGPGPG